MTREFSKRHPYFDGAMIRIDVLIRAPILSSKFVSLSDVELRVAKIVSSWQRPITVYYLFGFFHRFATKITLRFTRLIVKVAWRVREKLSFDDSAIVGTFIDAFRKGNLSNEIGMATSKIFNALATLVDSSRFSIRRCSSHRASMNIIAFRISCHFLIRRLN